MGFAIIMTPKLIFAKIHFLFDFVRILKNILNFHWVVKDCDVETSLTDSMPVVTCKGKNRKSKVAREVVDKGYCSTKNMYYYGVKLHLLGFRRQGTIPFSEFIGITAASENDLTAFKELFGEHIYNRVIFGDKIFSDKPYFDLKEDQQNIQMLTPVKLPKCEREAHFACFPDSLIVDCIKAGCPESGIVLDPFMGSGTTAVVARKLYRNYVGFELNPEYVEISERKLRRELGMFA